MKWLSGRISEVSAHTEVSHIRIWLMENQLYSIRIKSDLTAWIKRFYEKPFQNVWLMFVKMFVRSRLFSFLLDIKDRVRLMINSASSSSKILSEILSNIDINSENSFPLFVLCSKKKPKPHSNYEIMHN